MLIQNVSSKRDATYPTNGYGCMLCDVWCSYFWCESPQAVDPKNVLLLSIQTSSKPPPRRAKVTLEPEGKTTSTLSALDSCTQFCLAHKRIELSCASTQWLANIYKCAHREQRRWRRKLLSLTLHFPSSLSAVSSFFFGELSWDRTHSVCKHTLCLVCSIFWLPEHENCRREKIAKDKRRWNKRVNVCEAKRRYKSWTIDLIRRLCAG